MRGVVVLGMSRSGTSAVTRAFNLSGYFVGKAREIGPSDDANPFGYFERRDVYRLHEEMLDSVRGRWYLPPDAAAQAALAARFVPRVRRIVEQMGTAAGGQPLVVKDPRIGVLMPTWMPIIETQLHPVLVLRHPLEIAASLQQRDRTPLALGLAMWEVHMDSVLRNLDGRCVTVARYDRLMDSPNTVRAVVAAASEQLDEELVRSVRTNAAPSALRAELYHNRIVEGDSGGALRRRQNGLWQWLSGRPSGSQLIALPDSVRSGAEAATESVLSELRRELHDQSYGPAARMSRSLRNRLERMQRRALNRGAALRP